jgi:imidazolonepropionase
LSQFTLLYGARQLLTLRGPSGPRRGSDLQELAIIENGSVLIENGLIYCIGPTRRIENLKESRDAVTIDAAGAIIMPGLIDADCTMTYNGAELGRTRRPARIYDDGLALMRSCLHHGTICAVLKASAETGSFQSDISLLRQFTRIGKNPVDTVRTWHLAQPLRDENHLIAFCDALETLARRRLLDCISISSSAAGSTAFSSCLTRVFNTGLPTHAQWNGGSAAELRDLLDQVRPRAVSCPSMLSAAEVEVLAASKAICVFAPGSEMGRSIGSGMRRLADLGASIALSSGYHPIDTPGVSMQMAVSLAALQGGLSVEAAIIGATVNAAYAGGFGETIGVIEKGRRANLLVMNVPDYHEIPRQLGINHVGTVIKDGNIVLNHGRWTMGANAAAVGGVRS